ncbi:MAG TPA: hypothetical protein EYN66_14465, partial [Myxococcales bacterium]|nr:hypothetical protein [Myxococcales bacterium]
MIRNLIISVTCVMLLAGCSQMLRVQKATRKVPVRVPASKPIGLSPPAIMFEVGTVVGGHAMNPNKSYHLEHRWRETFEIDPNEFNFAL